MNKLRPINGIRIKSLKYYSTEALAESPSTPNLPSSTTIIDTASKKDNTKKALSLLAAEPNYYAIVKILSKPYYIQKNNLIFTPKINKLVPGDVINITSVTEIGNKEYLLQGAPNIDPSYFKITACVIEHNKSKPIVVEKKKKRGQNRVVVNENHHTVLRVQDIRINKDPNREESLGV